MEREEYRVAAESVIYLITCAVKDIVPDRARIDSMDLAKVYEVAVDHKLASAAGMALEKAGVRDERFVKAVALAQRNIALLDAERAVVLEKMEETGIWYMPLKGSVLKNLYPRYGMREMVDNDILFDRERGDDLRQIMVGRGFTVENYDNGPHDIYLKKPVYNFEMHRTLFSATGRKDLYPYFADVKDRLVLDAGKAYSYHFTDEDFYLYITTHEYKHYTAHGTGLRSLMDIYVYLTHKSLDMDYVLREAKKIGIDDFERRNRELAFHLFEGKELTIDERKMLDYIVFSGSYGTDENYADNQVAEKGRWKYFLSRLFLPRDVLEGMFPILKKAPFLYPVCWVLRLLRGVLFRNKVVRVQLKAALGLNKRDNE